MVDLAITPSAQSLLTCVQERMLLNPNPPQHFQLRVGLDPVAADFGTDGRDYCCEGLVYVRVIRRFPSGNNWPVRDEVSINCSPAAWAAELEIGSFRCVPAGDNHMDANAWEAAFENVQNDQEAMVEAICCWVDDQKVNNRYWMNYIIRDWFPFSNQGGCAGGAISVTAQFESCC